MQVCISCILNVSIGGKKIKDELKGPSVFTEAEVIEEFTEPLAVETAEVRAEEFLQTVVSCLWGIIESSVIWIFLFLDVKRLYDLLN